MKKTPLLAISILSILTIGKAYAGPFAQDQSNCDNNQSSNVVAVLQRNNGEWEVILNTIDGTTNKDTLYLQHPESYGSIIMTIDRFGGEDERGHTTITNPQNETNLEEMGRVDLCNKNNAQTNLAPFDQTPTEVPEFPSILATAGTVGVATLAVGKIKKKKR